MGLADIPINTIKEFSAFGINVIVPRGSGIITTSRVVLADRQRLQFIDDLLCDGIRHKIIRCSCRKKNRDLTAGNFFIGKPEQFILDQREANPKSGLIIVIRLVDGSIANFIIPLVFPSNGCVPSKSVNRSCKGVGPASGNGIDAATRKIAKCNIKRCRLYLNFLDGVQTERIGAGTAAWLIRRSTYSTKRRTEPDCVIVDCPIQCDVVVPEVGSCK